MIALPLKLIPYARRFRRDVLRLVNDWRCRLHVHLDWQTLDEWIDQPETTLFLAWQDSRLVAAVAAAPPQEDTTWVRLLAVHEDVEPARVLAELWPALRERLIRSGVYYAGLLLSQSWLAEYLPPLGFSYIEQIVTLRRESMDVPAPLRHDVVIRHADVRETETALAIDHAAFEPMWRMHAAAMRHAIRNAASFTLAEINRRVVGYQITTLHMRAAHLARLGVLPDVQGGGVGGALLSELLGGLVRRGIISMSVNTQSSNVRSQRLYLRYGFALSGLEMPYWLAVLDS